MNKVYRDENGYLHREDGPAKEYRGFKEWWIHGKLHREDGPAKKWTNGTKLWYISGKWHREDGPAIDRPHGKKSWYLKGEFIMGTKGPVTDVQIKEFRLRLLK